MKGGISDTPVVFFDGCIHGDEVAGALALDSLLNILEVEAGTVVIMPRVNIIAYNKNKRGVNVDLNQVFPGNKDGSHYEERLAYDFMNLVSDIKPDLVINLHEAWTRYDESFYQRQKDKSFGQTIITNNDTFPSFLIYSLVNINDRIQNKENIFRIQYFPFKANHSMDNIIKQFNIPSYTIETLRILPIEERISYQLYSILAFCEELGIKYKIRK